MPNVPITIATSVTDRTRPIMDGRVKVDGCDVTFLPMEIEELFFRAIRFQEFDVCELSMSSYMMQKQRGQLPFIAIPVFLSRAFRHSGIYIRTDRGINGPADLRGKTIGVPEYQMTAVVWQRGILRDEYGIHPREIHWRNGGTEQPGRVERAPLKVPDEIDLQAIPNDKTLAGMLASGELDAVMMPRAPSCFTAGHPNVGRLFPDYRPVEEAYYRKTGLFPLMHLVAVRESLVERYPWLPANIYKAFREAKDVAMADLNRIISFSVSLPWVLSDIAATKKVLGEDIWPYGIEPNRKAIETLVRYSHEDGLTQRQMPMEELFHPATFQIAKI
ncbi:MAG: PhnD/SsuA/transferrin family substrate-binding protein [Alphaproteobacteria bacterium]